MGNQTLYKIASQARRDLKRKKISDKLLIDLYKKYNPLIDIEKFIEESKKLFPKLNCGLATVYLKHLIQEGEIINGKYEDKNHTFLLLKSKIVLDITSDQYGGPKIYVGKLKKPWSP